MTQYCANCNQANSDWATECGRCGFSFVRDDRLPEPIRTMILVVALLMSAFMFYGALVAVYWLFNKFG